MQTKFLAISLLAVGALANPAPEPQLRDAIATVVSIAGADLTSAVGGAINAATSAAAAAGSDIKSAASVAASGASSVGSRATSAAAAGAAAVTSKAVAEASQVASKWESAESKWKTYSGWETFKSGYSSKKAEGSAALNSYLATQQVLPSTAVAAAASELAARITAPFSSGAPSATGAAASGAGGAGSGAADAPRLALGAVLGVVGFVAGAFVL